MVLLPLQNGEHGVKTTMMQGGIYLLQDNGQLVDMKAQAYDSEAFLQELLATYPRLLLRGMFRPVAIAVIVHICPGRTLLRGPAM